MHIGLIVGIGPAATDYDYRQLIGTLAQKCTLWVQVWAWHRVFTVCSMARKCLRQRPC